MATKKKPKQKSNLTDAARAKSYRSPRIGKRGKGKKTLAKEKAMDEVVKDFKEQLAKALPDVTEALLDAATGHLIVAYDKEGDEKLYTEKPNVGAIKEINDRLFGRSKETIEHLGGGLQSIIAFVSGTEAIVLEPRRAGEGVTQPDDKPKMENEQSVLREERERTESTIQAESSSRRNVRQSLVPKPSIKKQTDR